MKAKIVLLGTGLLFILIGLLWLVFFPLTVPVVHNVFENGMYIGFVITKEPRNNSNAFMLQGLGIFLCFLSFFTEEIKVRLPKKKRKPKKLNLNELGLSRTDG